MSILLLYWNRVVPDDYPLAQRRLRDLRIPRMLSDLLDTVTRRRVRVQHLLQHVFRVRRQKVWQLEHPLQDLLIQQRGVGILEGEVAAEHGVEDDAAAPDVDGEAFVLFASDHLGM